MKGARNRTPDHSLRCFAQPRFDLYQCLALRLHGLTALLK